MPDTANKVLRAPLVGMHFRPPAKVILASLPAGAGLQLELEPENPYDPKALRVLVSPDEIPAGQHESLAEALPASGHELHEVLAGEPVWLGYVADSDGKICQTARLPGNRELGEAMLSGPDWTCRLGFDATGKPLVVMIVPSGQDDGQAEETC